MKYLALSLTILSAVSLGSLRVARADPVPVEGTRELRLGNSFGPFSMFSSGFSNLSPAQGTDMTIVGIGAGLGYFVAEHVEVGGTVGYFYMSQGSGSEKGPGFTGFLRLYSKTGSVGVFFEPTLEFQYLSGGASSSKILGPGFDVGVDVFLADSWALRLSPTFRYYKEWAAESTNVTKFGVTWGISAYF